MKTQHSARRKTRLAGLAAMGAVILATGLLSSTATFASHPEVSLTGSNFEIDTDANLKVDDAGSLDWANVTEKRKADAPSGTGDNSFGQGTKEDTAVPTVVSGSIPPNKSDLKFFGAYQEGTSSTGFLNLFWSRVQDPTGTTNMDFEFNQSKTASSNGVTPVRTAGDLLITYDLSNGGTNPTLGKRIWNGTAWGPYTPFSDTVAAGSINTTAIPAAESDGLGAQSARTFGEASIRLSAILGTSGCTTFGSAYLKSRSSDTFSSALKDFVAPEVVDITNCGAITINKADDLGAALNGAVFSLYNDNPTVGGTRTTGDTLTSPLLSCTTAGSGTCTITNVPFGSYWVVETTTPDGYTTAANQATAISSASASVSLSFVDPRIILNPTISTAQSFVPNDSATVTVSSTQGDLAGSVVFKLYDNATCSGTPLYSSGSVPIASGTGTGVNKTVSSANTTAYTVSTTFSWLVTYTSTNTRHNDATSVCDLEHSSISIDNNHTTP